MEWAQDSSIITMETAAVTEDKNKSAAVPVTTAAADHGGDQMKKKKRGGMNLIRVALFMLRRRSGKSKTSVHAEVASKGMWKRLLGSMRPLHLQHNQSPPPSSIEAPPPSAAAVEAPVNLQITNEQFEEVLPPPMSPISTSSIASSRYASAVNLQELDRSEEQEEEEDCENIMDDNGDTMIDAKAEEFIAYFYEQMRLQRIDSINRYNEMMERRMG